MRSLQKNNHRVIKNSYFYSYFDCFLLFFFVDFLRSNNLSVVIVLCYVVKFIFIRLSKFHHLGHSGMFVSP